MIRKILLTTICTLAMSGIAMAGHCPKDAKAITAGLGSSSADAATKSQIEALRDEGMALHNSGKHRESEAKMAEAMRLLLTS